MAQAVSNVSPFFPLSSVKTRNVRYPVFSKQINGGGCFSHISKNSLKAMAGDARDNLDHMQRATKLQQQQAQPRKRAAPAPPIGLWDRFPTAKTVQQMMETMEGLMDDPFAYSGGYRTPVPSETGGYSRGRAPWEIKEGEDAYKVRFDMPGMTKEDVKVWVEEKMLVVKAEKAVKKTENGAVVEENGEEWSAKSYGRYSSRIALPENIQFEKIKAEVKDGVLYITIPKASMTSKILDINVC
ncbi:small heat shock protein, chloroplastic-like [Malus sylvestris]|uniref:small heat shock protein, chloroplastic-like n=1 Tax=Malus sylvestris TaxID=3752 RepID=UPI0021AC9DAE|nr:small heat shock protein, chloroplastic-like [Malus sylvestris]